MAANVRHPDVEVQLSGEDGNAFMMIGRVSKSLRSAGVEAEEIKEFQAEATSGDYGFVIDTIQRWVTVL